MKSSPELTETESDGDVVARHYEAHMRRGTVPATPSILDDEERCLVNDHIRKLIDERAAFRKVVELAVKYRKESERRDLNGEEWWAARNAFYAAIGDAVAAFAINDDGVMQRAARLPNEIPDEEPEPEPKRAALVFWRTGKKLGRTLYANEVFVGTVDSAHVANQVVKACNQVQWAKAEVDVYRQRQMNSENPGALLEDLLSILEGILQ